MSLGKTLPLLALLVACAAPAPRVHAADAKSAGSMEYQGTGVVVALMPAPSSLHATRPVIVIHHDPLLPLMPEQMDMPFLAASPALLAKVRVGDRVTFTLRDTPDALLVVAVERRP